MNGRMPADDVWSALQDLRARRPLVHNITNYVAMTVSANVLLALGASPAMVHAAEEVEDFAGISDALCVNIGTLSPPWVEAMRKAVAQVNAVGKPWVLDPVGCGATPYRTRVSEELAALRPAVIRANAGEVQSLAGAAPGGSKGVDSLVDTGAAAAAAAMLSRRTNAVVAMTGAIDFVVDGQGGASIDGGHALMPLSTALGCALSAVVAAFTAVRPPRDAAVAALTIYGVAGAAAARNCRGPGHLPAELCDAFHLMSRDMLTA